VNSFTAVGKKFILLLACSILTVYKGVLSPQELAVTAAPATSVTHMVTTAIDIWVLFMVSPPFDLVVTIQKQL
jgi:hypothetical protein